MACRQEGGCWCGWHEGVGIAHGGGHGFAEVASDPPPGLEMKLNEVK